jgi:hypothetical protein
VRPDPHLDVFKTWFAAKRADETQVRYSQVFHEEGLPTPCRFHRRVFAPLRRTDNFVENLRKVLP